MRRTLNMTDAESAAHNAQERTLSTSFITDINAHANTARTLLPPILWGVRDGKSNNAARYYNLLKLSMDKAGAPIADVAILDIMQITQSHGYKLVSLLEAANWVVSYARLVRVDGKLLRPKYSNKRSLPVVRSEWVESVFQEVHMSSLKSDLTEIPQIPYLFAQDEERFECYFADHVSLEELEALRDFKAGCPLSLWSERSQYGRVPRGRSSVFSTSNRGV